MIGYSIRFLGCHHAENASRNACFFNKSRSKPGTDEKTNTE
jgi:hypothetical protein